MAKQILIVDDSLAEAKIVKQILESEAFTVEWAKDGVSGIAMAQELLPDLILMDVVMPGMNGFQATRCITRNSETSHIPVVILSTKSQETDKVWGMRQGATAYLFKPTKKEELLDHIKSLIN